MVPSHSGIPYLTSCLENQNKPGGELWVGHCETNRFSGIFLVFKARCLKTQSTKPHRKDHRKDSLYGQTQDRNNRGSVLVARQGDGLNSAFRDDGVCLGADPT